MLSKLLRTFKSKEPQKDQALSPEFITIRIPRNEYYEFINNISAQLKSHKQVFNENYEEVKKLKMDYEGQVYLKKVAD